MARHQQYSVAGYIELVSDLLRRDYVSVPLEEIEPGSRHLFLRHDVDMCLQRAVALAEAEHEAGLRSTYYVLVRTEMYNVSSKQGRALVRRLNELGHVVGLHFDAAGLPSDVDVLNREAGADCEILEAVTGAAVTSISFHRPVQPLQGLRANVAGRVHVYQPRYFKEIGYCSDSAGGFQYHHPAEHPAVASGTALQLLTHPIWWVGELETTPRRKLDLFLDQRVTLLRQELATNCKVFR
jgi:hypothetical protein